MWSCAARSPRAPPPSQRDAQAKARAQGLLSEGTAAYGRGDYAAALDKFTAAYKIFPSPKLWFNIGQANRDLGRPVEAVEAFDRFLRDAGDAPPETLAEARRSAAELKTKLGQIQVSCAVDGTEITVDGKQVGSTPLGEMLWTTPGRHQVAAQHAGFAPAIEDVVVTTGKIATVNIEVLPIDLRPANKTAAAVMGRSWGPAARPPPIRARRRSRPSIAGPGSGWRPAWSSPRARAPRSSSRTAAAAAVDPAACRRRRSARRGRSDHAALATAAGAGAGPARGRGCVRRRRRRRHPGGAVDRRDHAEPEAGVPELRQIRVNAHLANPAMDNDLLLSHHPAGPIQSGATLALLIPITRSGLLDLIVFGLDAGGTAVARGNGQTTIAVGDRVDYTISLSACGGPCN